MLHTKALYNLLRFNIRDDPTLPHEPWAVEDLRSLSIEELFARLAQKNVSLNRDKFISFAENSDTPEQLTEILLPDATDSKFNDSLYLILFELWRRLLPERPALSIFCDELDHRIELYDQNLLLSDEPIQDILANFQEILDENADAGIEPQHAFSSIEDYCAHDIESFLYDYISDLLDAENPLYASDLIDGFAPYVPEPIWFDILRIRLLSFTDIPEANRLAVKILKKNPDLSVLLEVLGFLSTAGDRTLFVAAVKQAIPLLETEEDFRELLALVSDYYRLLDLESLELAIQKLMQRRRPHSETLDQNDPDLKAFAQIIQ